MLGHNNSTSCHNGDIGDLVIVNTTDIYCSIRFLYDAKIVTSNASIGSSIHKQARFVELVGGDRVKDAMGMDLTIPLAIDHNLLILGWRWRTCIGLAHKLSPLCILGLGGGQDISQVARIGRTFLLGQKGKQLSAVIFSVRIISPMVIAHQDQGVL